MWYNKNTITNNCVWKLIINKKFYRFLITQEGFILTEKPVKWRICNHSIPISKKCIYINLSFSAIKKQVAFAACFFIVMRGFEAERRRRVGDVWDRVQWTIQGALRSGRNTVKWAAWRRNWTDVPTGPVGEIPPSPPSKNKSHLRLVFGFGED